MLNFQNMNLNMFFLKGQEFIIIFLHLSLSLPLSDPLDLPLCHLYLLSWILFLD